jgi:hypothetical protein
MVEDMLWSKDDSSCVCCHHDGLEQTILDAKRFFESPPYFTRMRVVDFSLGCTLQLYNAINPKENSAGEKTSAGEGGADTKQPVQSETPVEIDLKSNWKGGKRQAIVLRTQQAVIPVGKSGDGATGTATSRWLKNREKRQKINRESDRTLLLRSEGVARFPLLFLAVVAGYFDLYFNIQGSF